MDIFSREYMFASELVMNVMQLYCSRWEPDIEALYEKVSPFTPKVKKANAYIWEEKKEFINDLFSTVLQMGTINMNNYEVPVKFASHLVTENEYDEIELLRYCVIAAGYATLFYQNGLKDVPNHCIHFIIETITTFRSKNEFNDESWYDIELLGYAYSKTSQSLGYFSRDGSYCFVQSCKSKPSSSNFHMYVSDRNTVKRTSKDNLPNAIKESSSTYIENDNVSCRAIAKKECSTNLSRTQNLKRKYTRIESENENFIGHSNSNTKTTKKKSVREDVHETNAIFKELSTTSKHKGAAFRDVACTSKNIINKKHKFADNTYSKDSFAEFVETKCSNQWQLASKNSAGIGALTKRATTKDKISKDAPEKTEIINFAGVEIIEDCKNVKEIEYGINMLKRSELQTEKMIGTNCKSKNIKSSKLKKVAMTIYPTEKSADVRYTSEKITSNKDTDEVTNSKEEPEEFMATKFGAKKVEPIHDNIKMDTKIHHAFEIVTKTKDVYKTMVKNTAITNKISETKHASDKVFKHESKKPKILQNEATNSLHFPVGTSKNATEESIQFINEDQAGNICLVMEDISTKSVINDMIITRYDEAFSSVMEGVGPKCKNKTINGCTNTFVENVTSNDAAQKVTENINSDKVLETNYGNAIKIFDENKWENASKEYEETKHVNASNECKEAQYENVNRKVAETRCTSNTENNYKPKSLQKVRKAKSNKCRVKKVAFKETHEKGAQNDKINKNLNHKISTKKPPAKNLIGHGKCVDKYAELKPSGVNFSIFQYLNENVLIPLESSDKELIEKNTKVRTPLQNFNKLYP